jgi:hypothetical protein
MCKTDIAFRNQLAEWHVIVPVLACDDHTVAQTGSHQFIFGALIVLMLPTVKQTQFLFPAQSRAGLHPGQVSGKLGDGFISHWTLNPASAHGWFGTEAQSTDCAVMSPRHFEIFMIALS